MSAREKAPSDRRAPAGLTVAEGSAQGVVLSGGVTEIQRARILAAMAELCAEQGVANVTVARIVSRSGVSRRTFYELFVDRDDCLLATMEDALEALSARMADAYSHADRWRARVRAGLVALLSFLEEEPFMGRLLVVQTLAAGRSALDLRNEVLDVAIKVVDEGRAESERGKTLPPLTAEGLVGGAASVIHSRLLEENHGSLLELTSPLMSMIVLPYLGSAAAAAELERAAPVRELRPARSGADPLRDVKMRLTYRTVRVLMAVGNRPGSSNREIAIAADIQDQGQISKLLTRLAKLDLIKNSTDDQIRGAPNAWILTGKGAEIEQTLGQS